VILGCVCALVDPRDGCIRYVGMTTKNLVDRLSEHMCQTHLRGITHKDKWIRLLKRNGLRAEIIALQGGIPLPELPGAERGWIAKLNRGQLTNGTEGGEGVFGYKHTDETKKLLAEKTRARVATPETRAKMSRAHKGREREFTDEWRANLSIAAKRRCAIALERRASGNP